MAQLHRALALLLGIALPPAMVAATATHCVTMTTYTTGDCSDTGAAQKWSVQSTAGSPCVDLGALSVKDQFCDANMSYHQTLYGSTNCSGSLMTSSFTNGQCIMGMKVDCAAGACPAASASRATGISSTQPLLAARHRESTPPSPCRVLSSACMPSRACVRAI
mmetsp:Transcript_57522/g.171199  ORF Transcript_57522/g.171199 Transcript_57522/m.171199 type:complete len:163 (-) Transcript_57522:28-516(-)